MTATAPGGDARRAALEEERDQLLRALDLLDEERADGDLDAGDYEALHDSYTARAAAVLRSLDETAPKADAAKRPAEGNSRGSTVLMRPVVLVGLAVFAIGAGLLLARASGERGVDDQITGEIAVTGREQVIECQELGAGGGDLVGALECFDDVLAREPQNAEALAYRGWYLLLAAGSLQQASEEGADTEEAQQLIGAGLVYLDQAIEADPRLPDPLAFRATVYDRLGQAEEACADVVALRALDPAPFFLQQTAGIADRNGCG
ncbi:MAG: hypothetical protein AAF467_04470 [Actinomycetota bacterium]